MLAFGDERQYAGNAGYEDVLTTHYRYDTHVPNHGRVAANDIFVIRGPQGLEGFARVVAITDEQTTKRTQRCPECKTTAIKTRTTRQPLYRCDNGHEFDAPLIDEAAITMFTAHFGDTYLAAPGYISLERLRAACPRWNGQLAIQKLDLQAIESDLQQLANFTERVLGEDADSELTAEDADDADSSAPYVPEDADTRTVALRQVRERRGQAAFRRSLIERYGPSCLVTGCAILDLLEAAHINAYRGNNDNHVDNGLLLRADVHTLFDLDLLGIDPDTLKIDTHPRIREAGYEHIRGCSLRCAPHRPARPALQMRWAAFQRRLLRA